ncbi:MAG: hypothetical protein VCG02_15725 [Verrucomicrobiota bacterium]
MESSNEFQMGAPGIDAEKIVAEIRAEVARKREEGVYHDARIARAERHNLIHMQDSNELLRFYLATLRDIVTVDISDWSIRDRRGGVAGKVLVKLKTVIWKFLKFYTYRLWSQQNLVNGLMHSAVEGTFTNYERRIAKLEARIVALEGGKDGPDPENETVDPVT